MNLRIFFWSLTAALAVFFLASILSLFPGLEKTIQSLWSLSPGLHGIAMASALYGTVAGSLLGAWPADRFGRKATLLWIECSTLSAQSAQAWLTMLELSL